MRNKVYIIVLIQVCYSAATGVYL